MVECIQNAPRWSGVCGRDDLRGCRRASPGRRRWPRSALDGVVLLSEINPQTIGRGRFNSFDPVLEFLQRYPQQVDTEDLRRIFKSRIRYVAHRCRAMSARLVIRDHSHSDFLANATRRPALRAWLAEEFSVCSVVTVRHPLDAWLGMIPHGYHREIRDLDMYCGRVKTFLDHYREVPLYRYEDFVRDPESLLRSICSDLELAYSADFRARLPSVHLSGGTGRSRQTDPIGALERRPVPRECHEAMAQSVSYRLLCARLGYQP